MSIFQHFWNARTPLAGEKVILSGTGRELLAFQKSALVVKRHGVLRKYVEVSFLYKQSLNAVLR